MLIICCSSPGYLNEGDEIAEINGTSVANQSVDQLQKILASPYCLYFNKEKYAEAHSAPERMGDMLQTHNPSFDSVECK